MDTHINVKPPKALQFRAMPEDLKDTSSYDSLMRLKTLEDCIWDAEATRKKVSKIIETILEREQDSINAVRKVGQASDDLKRTQGYLSMENYLLGSAVKKRDKLRQSLEARRIEVAKASEHMRSTEKHLVEAKVKLAESKELLKRTNEGIMGQQRRILTELQTIYSIDPVGAGTARVVSQFLTRFLDTRQSSCIHNLWSLFAKYGI